MSEDLVKMSPEELIQHVAQLKSNNVYEGPEIEKVEKVLNAKLLNRVAGRLEGLGSGLTQLNTAILRGVEASNTAAASNDQHARVMARLTKWLVIAAIGQAVVALIYTGITSRLVNLSAMQLAQSQVDSNLVNRPYVDIRPIALQCSEETDPKDPTSTFCDLFFEATNHSGQIPASEVRLKELKIGSESRGFFTAESVPPDFDQAALFPQSSAGMRVRFVLNRTAHLERYQRGLEDLLIRVEINYTTPKVSKSSPMHWYRGDWAYTRGTFFLRHSETDKVDTKVPGLV